MHKFFIWLILAGSLFNPSVIFGQNIEVSEPLLEMRGNIIHISYNILNSTRSNNFTVELVVRDEDGKEINARAITGDIGDMVSGGNDKHIAWDLETDQIEINADIFVKIYVKAIHPSEPVVVAPAPVDNVKKEAEISARISGAKQFSRTGLVLQSLAFPGLGLSRYKGEPHWIRGVLGYSCVAGSIIMNQAAVNTYAGIIDESGYDAKTILYQEALKQDQISEVLAYTAIAIWVSDLIWSIVGTSDLNKSSSHQKGLRINSSIDPVSNSPLLAFTYKF